MRYKDGLAALNGGTPEERSRWWLFPWAITVVMLIVIAVNGGMVYLAMHTFPGQAGSDGFDLSNRYNAVLARVQQQQAELGWTLFAVPDGARRPVLQLTDRSGEPLTGALVQAKAERPVGPKHLTTLLFHETAPGHYVANAALDEPGQWELLLSAQAQGHRFITSQRILAQ